MSASDGVPHTFPAAVIGGFGVPSRKQPTKLRYNEVAVRLAAKPHEIFSPMGATNVSKVRDEYALEEPPPGVHRNLIDGIWGAYEPDLPSAIRALERGRPSQSEWELILIHVQAQGVRSPRFRERAKEYLQLERGVMEPTKDQLQSERLATLVNTPKVLAACRFAVVRRPPDGRRFIANDMGYTAPLQDMEFGVKCLIFPLSSEVAVLAAFDVARPGDDYEGGPMEDLTMTPATVDVMNEASWRLAGIACVFGHPDDSDYLLGLNRERVLRCSALGPYRGTCDVGLTDWAVIDQRTTRLTLHDWKGI